MFDEIIANGTIIDGTGTPGVVGDLGISGGRIAAIGPVGSLGPATVTYDATGMLVTPGIIDPHTHYDAQLLWDATASPSSIHGVTTVIGGNCGFTLAPLRPGDGDYLRRMMAKVEGMPLPALEHGTDWSWETFADYLGRLDGNISVNAGFMAGHCALRRYVMGTDAVGNEATPAQLDAIVGELRAALQAGALGFSFTTSSSHSDGDGEPVASRWASVDELMALATETGRHDGTSLEGIVPGCLDQFSDAEIDMLAAMSAAAGRPLNWNVLTVDARVPERVGRQLEAAVKATATGGRVVALTMPIQVPMNMSFLNFCGLWLIPGWNAIMNCSVPERIERLRDADTRLRMLEFGQAPEAGVFRRLADWGYYVIGDTFSQVNEGLKGRSVRDIAAERGQSSFGCLLDIVIADDLRTVLWPTPQDDDDASWAMRRDLWLDGRAMIGGSDAGAHLDRMCGAPYPTRFLGDCLRGRQLVPVETAVKLMTNDPASLFGLTDRGVLREGSIADIAIFDPGLVDSGPATLVHDLPASSARLVAASAGVRRVMVSGVTIVVDGVANGATPGVVLRSGVDTHA